MQGAAHIALERLIDHLVLLHTVFAAERLADNLGGKMVAIAGKVKSTTSLAFTWPSIHSLMAVMSFRPFDAPGARPGYREFCWRQV